MVEVKLYFPNKYLAALFIRWFTQEGIEEYQEVSKYRQESQTDIINYSFQDRVIQLTQVGLTRERNV